MSLGWSASVSKNSPILAERVNEARVQIKAIYVSGLAVAENWFDFATNSPEQIDD